MAKKIIRNSRNTRKAPKVRRKAIKRTASPGGARQAVSKLDSMIAALRAPKGATVAQLSALTGWLPHSVRGAMSGALKKKRGFTITSTKPNGERVYRLKGEA